MQPRSGRRGSMRRCPSATESWAERGRQWRTADRDCESWCGRQRWRLIALQRGPSVLDRALLANPSSFTHYSRGIQQRGNHVSEGKLSNRGNACRSAFVVDAAAARSRLHGGATTILQRRCISPLWIRNPRRRSDHCLHDPKQVTVVA
jgi:hypothetical protein